MGEAVKHKTYKDSVAVIHERDGRPERIFLGLRKGSDLTNRVRFNGGPHVLAADILDTFEYLLDADQREARKQLGHLRAAYRKSRPTPRDEP